MYPIGGNVAATLNVGKRERDDDEEKGRAKKKPKGVGNTLRKKRNVNTSPVQDKYALIKVVDTSSTSNLSLTTCTFEETYDGVEELHLEKGVFIKDPKTTGENEVSVFVNEIQVPERASTTQHISITLTGRT